MRARSRLSCAAMLLALVAVAVPAQAQAPLLSSPTSGTPGVDPAAPLTLAWTTVPTASAYVVELSADPSFATLLPLKDAQVPAQAGRLGQSYLVAFTDDTALRGGHRYYWRVSALVNAARIVSAVAFFTTASDPFGWLADRHLSLTRAEDGVDKDKPATIAFIRQGGASASQQVVAEFLLGWQGNSRFVPRQSGFAIAPAVAFAGKMSSDTTAEDTLAKVFGGLVADWSFGDAPTRSLYQTLDVAYEGDQAFGGANLLVEYLITYSGPRIGRFHPAAAAAPAQILVRPYLLATFAKPLDTPASTADDAQTRVGPQVDVKVQLNAVARALGISGALLSVTDRWYLLSGSERDRANYVTVAVDLQVAKGFTVGYSYRRGRDAPAFRGVNRMALTVGVGFGG